MLSVNQFGPEYIFCSFFCFESVGRVEAKPPKNWYCSGVIALAILLAAMLAIIKEEYLSFLILLFFPAATITSGVSHLSLPEAV